MRRLEPGHNVVHVQLAEGLPRTQDILRNHRQFVVLWWQEQALGHIELSPSAPPAGELDFARRVAQAIAPAVGFRLTTEAFAPVLPELPGKEPSSLSFEGLVSLLKIDRPLRSLRTDDAAPTDTISVIVCTRDRPHLLRQCLDSLCSMSRSPDEIIVVDNASSSTATRELVSSYREVRYVSEPEPGLDRARNRGVLNSRGDIVAFTDDDATVHPAWCDALRVSFLDRSIGAVTGLVLPAELDTPAQLLFERYWGFSRGYRELRFDAGYFDLLKRKGVPAWNVGAGVNMAFRRASLEEIGLFDDLLDVGAAGCSGDSELWYRFLAAGKVCLYSPRAIVFHRHRRESLELARQLHDYMKGHTAALCIQFARHLHWGNLLRLFVVLPLYYLKMIAAGVRSGFRSRHQYLWREISGSASGVWYFLRHLHQWQRVPDQLPSARRTQTGKAVAASMSGSDD